MEEGGKTGHRRDDEANHLLDDAVGAGFVSEGWEDVFREGSRVIYFRSVKIMTMIV